MARFWGDVARGFGPAYAASTARTDRRTAAELAQANLLAQREIQGRNRAEDIETRKRNRAEDIEALKKYRAAEYERLLQAQEDAIARKDEVALRNAQIALESFDADIRAQVETAVPPLITGVEKLPVPPEYAGSPELIRDIRESLEAERGEKPLTSVLAQAMKGKRLQDARAVVEAQRHQENLAKLKIQANKEAAAAQVTATKTAADAERSAKKDAALLLAASQVTLANVNHGNNVKRLDAANVFSVQNAKTAADSLDKRADAAEKHAILLQTNQFESQTDRDNARVAAEKLRDESNAAQDLAAKLDAAYLSSGAVLKDNEKLQYRDAALQKDYPKMLEILAKAKPLAEEKKMEAEGAQAKELKEAIPGAAAPQLSAKDAIALQSAFTPEEQEAYNAATPKRERELPAAAQKRKEEAEQAHELKLKGTSAPSQPPTSVEERRNARLIEIADAYPNATPKVKSNLERQAQVLLSADRDAMLPMDDVRKWILTGAPGVSKAVDAPTESPTQKQMRITLQDSIVKLDDLISKSQDENWTGVVPTVKSKVMDEFLQMIPGMRKHVNWERLEFRKKAGIIAFNIIKAINEESRMSDLDLKFLAPLVPRETDEYPEFQVKLKGIRSMAWSKLQLQDASVGKERVLSLPPEQFFKKMADEAKLEPGIPRVIPLPLAPSVIKFGPQFKYKGTISAQGIFQPQVVSGKRVPITALDIVQLVKEGKIDENAARMWLLHARLPIPRR